MQVIRIKEKIEEQEGIPPVQQRLISKGKQMFGLSNVPCQRTPR